MNSSVHSSIGVSPEDLIYGKAINLDRSIFLSETDTNQLNLSHGTAQMLKVQRKLLLQAVALQQEKDISHLTSRPDTVTVFPVNSF